MANINKATNEVWTFKAISRQCLLNLFKDEAAALTIALETESDDRTISDNLSYTNAEPQHEIANFQTTTVKGNEILY